ncbi:MBL fold metallo-hydrolase [bacterium]|nr:MBL fold metallo-hydrolase [bacterium]
MLAVATVFVVIFSGCLTKPSPALPPEPIKMAPGRDTPGQVEAIWIMNTGIGRAPGHIMTGTDGSGTVRIPFLCALIKWGSHFVLVDTGLNHHFGFDPTAYWGGSKLFAGRMSYEVRSMLPGQDVVAQITTLGLTPDDIDKIILTNVHFDHTGELQVFGKTPILMGRGEIDYMLNAPKARGVRKEDVPLAQVREVDFRRTEPYLTFPGYFDLYGDGSIILLPAPGRTPGSMAVLVRTRTTEYLLVGEAAQRMENIAAADPIGETENEALAENTLERLRRLRRAQPDLPIVTTHDPRYLAVDAKTPFLLTGDRLFPE